VQVIIAVIVVIWLLFSYCSHQDFALAAKSVRTRKWNREKSGLCRRQTSNGWISLLFAGLPVNSNAIHGWAVFIAAIRGDIERLLFKIAPNFGIMFSWNVQSGRLPVPW